MSRFRLISNKKGFNLVEVMIATALLTIAGVSMMGLSQLANQDSVQLRATRVALTARTQIEAALKNPTAWRQTVAQNTSFACITSATGCSLASGNNGYYDFVLFGTTPGEKITFDPTDLTTRYNIQGGPCPAGASSTDSQCPIKYIATWKPLCQNYPCTNPPLDIKISLAQEFGSKAPPLNSGKYEYATVRGLDDGSLQSACQILNGTYNIVTGTCYPKNAGKSCAAIGKPAQIISSVASDGSITCTPLYTKQCDPLTQVMTGINALGEAQCAARVQPANCPTPCIGGWDTCSATCGGGTQTYKIITAATNGGPACTAPAPGAVQNCNTQPCPVDCVGAWSGCSEPCGTGSMTYSISTPAANGGKLCTDANGAFQTCNTQPCAVKVDCAGSWSSCNQVTGTKTFTITQAPQNGGAACPAPLTQSCPVNCVGSWGACGGGSPQYKTFTWTTPPLNGGSACLYPNGQTDSSACPCVTYCQSSSISRDLSCTVGTSCSFVVESETKKFDKFWAQLLKRANSISGKIIPEAFALCVGGCWCGSCGCMGNGGGQPPGTTYRCWAEDCLTDNESPGCTTTGTCKCH